MLNKCNVFTTRSTAFVVFFLGQLRFEHYKSKEYFYEEGERMLATVLLYYQLLP